ncbi:hypothetical protein IJ732_00030 [bacterium]|nr:hypothetical protein [bacterium]
MDNNENENKAPIIYHDICISESSLNILINYVENYLEALEKKDLIYNLELIIDKTTNIETTMREYINSIF